MEVVLVEITRAYAEGLARILSTDQKLLFWLNPGSRFQPITSEILLADLAKWQSKSHGTTYAIIIGNTPIGTLSLAHIDMTDRSARIGYWLGSDYWGQGYATAAFSLALQKARSIKMNVVRAVISKKNLASLRLWQRYAASFIDDEAGNCTAEILLAS